MGADAADGIEMGEEACFVQAGSPGCPRRYGQPLGGHPVAAVISSAMAVRASRTHRPAPAITKAAARAVSARRPAAAGTGSWLTAERVARLWDRREVPARGVHAGFSSLNSTGTTI